MKGTTRNIYYKNLAHYHNKFQIHYILMFFGIFLLLQSLLAENVKNWPVLYTSIKYTDEIFSVSLFLLIIGYRILKQQKLERTNIDLVLGIFFGLAILSSLLEKVSPFIFVSQFVLYIKGYLLFYIIINLPMDLEILQKYKKVFLITAGIFLLFGLVDLAAPIQFRNLIGNIPTIDYRNNIPSVKSLFDHPWAFGWLNSFMSLFCFADFFFTKKRSSLAGGIIFFLGCFISMRFKAISGLLAALIMGFVMHPTKRKMKSGIVIGAFLIMILVFLGPAISNMLQTKVEQYFDEDAQFTMARNVFYIKSVTIARDYFPLGVGMGRYGSWMSRVDYSPIYIKYGMNKVWGLSEDFPNFINDTFWPMVLGETGFIGLISYLVIFFLFFRSLYRELDSPIDIRIRVFYLGTMMILIESLVESIAAPVYTSPPPLYFIFSALGICYAFIRKNRQTISREKT